MNKKNIWMIIGVLIVVFFIYNSSRGASGDFTRTVDKTNIRPGESIIVTYTSRNIAAGDPWLAELPIPAGMTYIPSINSNIELVGNTIKFYNFGSTSQQIILKSAPVKGVYSLEGFVYHARDDKTYSWCLLSCTYPATIISTCMDTPTIKGYLSQWVKGTITTQSMIEYIRQFILDPCPV